MNSSIAMRMLVWMLGDALIIGCSVIFAFTIRFELQIPDLFLSSIPPAVLLIVLCNYLFLISLKLYHRLWRYASTQELVAIIAAITLGIGFFILINELFFHLRMPRSVYVIVWMLSIMGIGFSRMVLRLYYESSLQKKTIRHKKALIVGAGSAGSLTARELRQSNHSDLEPVAFIDDNPQKRHMVINGLPVLGDRHDIDRVVKQQQISVIIIAMPAASRQQIREVIEICKQTGAAVKIFPQMQDYQQGKAMLQAIRDVDVEDLLGRDAVYTDLKGVAEYVSGRTVLVTGAGGSIGSELCRQISRFAPDKLILLGHGENSIYDIELELRRTAPAIPLVPVIADIRDKKRIQDIFALHRPDVVFHAAAHKHVPLMESNPLEAVKNNIFGTYHVAEAASQYGTERFVMISTDKAVNPTSIMGVTKRIAEMIIQSMNESCSTCFSSVRFGNVLGSRGSVIPVFKEQIKRGGPVTVTHPEMTRYFMTITEAVQLVIQAGAYAKGGEVFVLDMGEPVKIDKLARDLIRLSGLEPDVDIPVIYTGIRPGEKLFEKLLTEDEALGVTQHQRIFITFPDRSVQDIAFHLRKLEQLLNGDGSGVRDALMRMVPSFHQMAEEQQKSAT